MSPQPALSVTAPSNPARRGFLRTVASGAGALTLGLSLPGWAATLAGDASVAASTGEAEVTAWVRITADNTVTLIVSQAEIGQGISTTLPALLADELGADWAAVKLETAPFAPAYRNPNLNWMFTGNSESTQSFYALMRHTGAAAREMLVSVAARRWQVPAAECAVAQSRVTHTPSGRTFSFGELAAEAATLPVPPQPTLKPKAALQLVGRALARVDVPSKVNGSAVFGIDVQRPGMLIATVRIAPGFGGTLQSVDDAALLAEPGVVAVVPLPNGVGVVARTFYHAQQALRAHPPVFDAGPNATLASAGLMHAYREHLEHGPFAPAVREGDAAAVLAHAQRSLRADYENAFAAHATMEPMNCTAEVSATRCEIWAPTQGQEFAHVALKYALGLKDEQIVVHRTEAIGGGFGRRLLPDFVVQAALLARAVQRPVKLIWDREEDFSHDFYRPASLVRLEAALGADGLPRALGARVVSPTILLPVFPPIETMLREKGIDPSALEGMLEMPYALGPRQVDFHLLKTAIPTSVMRTTGFGPNLFALESFIDELAHHAHQDPLAYRRRLLRDKPRALAVLERVAQMSAWGTRLPKGHGKGLAFAEAFGTLIAQVLEVAVVKDAVRVLKAWTAVDCGEVLDPGIAAAGIEGGIVFGLAYAKTAVSFKNGQVEQRNFGSYELPYLAETPQMWTEFVPSGGKLGGVGEVSPVTVPPALVNALFAASGRRVRALPISRHGFHFA